MPTVKGVLQKYQEGQNIFRREAVACLVARIEQLEKYIASQQSAQADLATDCPNCGDKLFCAMCGEGVLLSPPNH